MKNLPHQMTFLSGLLLATPALASNLVESSPVALEVQTSKGTLYVSSLRLNAIGSLGLQRKVQLGIRIMKNGNSSSGHGVCSRRAQPDTISIEVLDPQTGEVLAVVKRMFGKIIAGENSLFRVSSTQGCVPEIKTLVLNNDVVTLSDIYGASTDLNIEGIATVKMPAQMIFRR